MSQKENGQAVPGCFDYANEATARIGTIRSAYRAHLAAWYCTEQRWPTEIFWQRRHAMSDARPEALSDADPQHA